MMLYDNGTARIDSMVKTICDDYSSGKTTFEQYLKAIAAYRYVNGGELEDGKMV